MGTLSKPERLAGAPGRHGRRVPVEADEDVLRAWLADKGGRMGFSLLSCRVPEAGWATARKRRNAEPMRFRCVLFEGVLRVDDVGLFGQALTAGIGPAKAFGFALLSVARATWPGPHSVIGR